MSCRMLGVEYNNIDIMNCQTTCCMTRPVARGGSRGSIEPPQNLTYGAHAQICKARAARALCRVCAGQGENG